MTKRKQKNAVEKLRGFFEGCSSGVGSGHANQIARPTGALRLEPLPHLRV